MINSVAIVGAGTMGNGIAHTFALHQFRVTLTDLNETVLNRALQTIARNAERQLDKGVITEAEKTNILSSISTTTSLEEGVADADLVIEAATENKEIKLKLFSQIDKSAPPGAILASNTSSISITALAAATNRPGQVIGMHFMNPVPVMKLVEVINGCGTEGKVTEEIVAISKKLEKVPCVVNDYPGFIANRLLMPMINEAIFALFEGVAGVEEIDTIMKLGMAHPMGPLQLADLIGLDVCLSILQVLYEGFGNPKYAPCPLLVNMVKAGNLGRKSGTGFYAYEEGGKGLKPFLNLRK